MYLVDACGAVVSVPAEWTDAVAADPFVVVSEGRSPFHIADLVELARLAEELASQRSPGVQGTTP